MTHELARKQQGGMQLRSFDDYRQFAETVVQSGMAPRGMNAAGILVCMQLGAELKLSPMQAIQNIACINGKPGLYGDGMLAVCRASGLFDDAEFSERIEGEGDQMTAICRVRRKPDGQTVEQRFDVKRARKAKLWGKSGPWSDYPERMLQMRARSFALRDTFPDVLKGLIAVEELRDYPEEPAPKQEPRTVEVIPAPAITHEAKPKKPAQDRTRYGEHGERLRELLTSEPEVSEARTPEAKLEAADGIVEAWSGGTVKSVVSACSDEQTALMILESVQVAEVRATTELFPAAEAPPVGPYGEGL